MFNTLSNLIGLRIDDKNIIDFIDKHGFKYPKKPYLSNRAADNSYWIENKKLGVDLLFAAQTFLAGYPLIKGDKKGIFVPVLSTVRWYNNKSATEFPLHLDFKHDFETLKLKLGEPTLKSSDISPVWLNDDGSESFYRWEKILDEQREHVWGLEYKDNNTISNFTLGLKYKNPLIQLYYEWNYETLDTILHQQAFYTTAYLLFLQWAIEKDLVKTNNITSGIIETIKAGKAPVTDWIQNINRGYIHDEDFVAENRFMRAYIKNLSSHDILYTRDLAHTFLPSDELKNNYFGAAATSLLNQLANNEATYTQVKTIIDQRLAEYQAHRFSRSKQL